MRLQNAVRLFSIGLLAMGLYAQSQAGQSGQKADRQQNETTMTGCLTKDASGGYTITDERSGSKMTVTGPSELEKHAANHTVTLTGTSQMEGDKTVFHATKIKHVAAECKGSGQ